VDKFPDIIKDLNENSRAVPQPPAGKVFIIDDTPIL